MPNHFHFLIEIKGEKELELFFNQKNSSNTTLQGIKNEDDDKRAFPKFKTLEKLISKQFSNLFSCYTQAFNKQQNRRGSLFMKNFKRKKISDTTYFLKLVKYIHYNPIQAKLSRQLNEWKFSSYASLVSKTPTLLKRDDLLAWYNDLANFEFVHKTEPTDNDYDIEE